MERSNSSTWSHSHRCPFPTVLLVKSRLPRIKPVLCKLVALFWEQRHHWAGDGLIWLPVLGDPPDETSRNPVSFSRNGWEPWLKGTKNLRRHQRGREIHYFPSKNQGIFKGFPEFLNHAWWHRGSTDRAQENAPRWAADFTRIPAVRASFGSRTRQHKNGMTMDDTSYGRTIGPPRAGWFIMEKKLINGKSQNHRDDVGFNLHIGPPISCCSIFWLQALCNKGVMCDFCHFRHPGTARTWRFREIQREIQDHVFWKVFLACK